jgi:hypothetical protein
MSIGIILPRGSAATQSIGILFVIATIYYFFRDYKSIKLFTTLYLLIIYLYFLIAFSSNFLYSLSNLASTTIWVLILPISFLVIDSLPKFKKLINSIALIGALYIINIIISTLFNIKGKSYSGEIFDVGNVFTEGLNSMAYLLTAAPLILYLNPKHKRLIIVLSVIIFILVLVQLKRISIIAILAGLLVNLFFSRNRINILFGLIISSLFLFIAYPLFESTLQKQVKVRERRLSTQNFEEEGRYQETFVVLDEIVYSGNPALLFFGKEVFNSPGNYANGRYGRRMIHNDYNVILHGSGVVGLILFVIWPIPLFIFYRKIKDYAKFNFEDKKLFDYMSVTFVSFLIMGYIISISGGVNAILFNSIRMAVLGAVLRIFFEHSKKHLQTNQL